MPLIDFALADTRLSADAQVHLLAAFQSRIPADDLIPAETRYRMYAEKVVRRPLSDWQAMTIEEARNVFKRLNADTPLVAPPTGPHAMADVLARVSRRQPLNTGDHAQVLALLAQGLMHVTPEFDRKDPCPYRLTAAGEDALRAGKGPA